MAVLSTKGTDRRGMTRPESQGGSTQHNAGSFLLLTQLFLDLTHIPLRTARRFLIAVRSENWQKKKARVLAFDIAFYRARLVICAEQEV